MAPVRDSQRLETIPAGASAQGALFPFLLSGIIALAFFALKHGSVFNLSDEGYLWYGAQRTFAGEVPLRDFRSYDPGRYYWAALCFKFLGPGLVSLRVSEAFFQWLGLFLGLLAARRAASSRLELAVLGVVLALWMEPDYKYFDCAIPCAAVYAGLKLLEKADGWSSWAAGTVAGLAVFLGRNHGLYLLAAFTLLGFCLSLRDGFSGKKLGFCGFGLLCGTLPLAGMILGYPGFWEGFWSKSTLPILRSGKTNLALPLPWPWTHFHLGLESMDGADTALGLFTLGVPLALLYWAFQSFRRMGKDGFDPLLASSALTGLPYLHYYFSRADYEHLGVAIGPFWIAAFSQWGCRPRARLLAAVLALATTLATAGVKSDFFFYWNAKAHWPFPVELGRDVIRVPAWEAVMVKLAESVKARLPAEETFLAYPHFPGLYAACGLKSPTWEIYDLFPESREEQEQVIREIQKARVHWAFIDNEAIDGRDDLRFQNTNPIFCAYLLSHFKRVNVPFLPPDCYLFFREAGAPARARP